MRLSDQANHGCGTWHREGVQFLETVIAIMPNVTKGVCEKAGMQIVSQSGLVRRPWSPGIRDVCSVHSFHLFCVQRLTLPR